METKPSAASECIICHEVKLQGIRICGQFICSTCEQDIVHSDVQDARYQHYVNEMKRIWWSALALDSNNTQV
ncbi:sigma factor G inhibitor Gin [Alicyclobacillus dauci]|uniref:Sigma factor G inhibitor Gin n=1 Tax=Alicyclobacillus dauci TaxID=1475485 RepID=A0ABY6Z380_9BACL|nr:sigma factor G inhibitor Gin [Alicyclobacillus dauci]